jgi:hypothetical protein
MGSLIAINRQMLAALNDLKRGQGHPEAQRSKVASRTSQDYGVVNV